MTGLRQGEAIKWLIGFKDHLLLSLIDLARKFLSEKAFTSEAIPSIYNDYNWLSRLAMLGNNQQIHLVKAESFCRY